MIKLSEESVDLNPIARDWLLFWTAFYLPLREIPSPPSLTSQGPGRELTGSSCNEPYQKFLSERLRLYSAFKVLRRNKSGARDIVGMSASQCQPSANLFLKILLGRMLHCLIPRLLTSGLTRMLRQSAAPRKLFPHLAFSTYGGAT